MPARVSFYRPNGQSRRQARTTNEHEVFEGLPVRRWERQWVHVGKLAPPPPPEPELPLPRESHLLTPMAQALLHAARASAQGRPQKITAPAAGQLLFQTKRWIQVPKDKEAPEPVYLGKPPGIIKKRAPETEPLPPPPPPPPIVRPIRRAPPPKRRGKGRGRRPGIVRKTVTFVEEGTQPVFEGGFTPASFQVLATPAPAPSAAPASPPVPAVVQPTLQVEDSTTGPTSDLKILKKKSAKSQREKAAVKGELPAGGDVSVRGEKSAGKKKKALVEGKKKDAEGKELAGEAQGAESLKEKKGKAVSLKKKALADKTGMRKVGPVKKIAKKSVSGKKVASGEAVPEGKELGSGTKKKLDSGEKTLAVRERKPAIGENKKPTSAKKDALGKKVASGKAKKVSVSLKVSSKKVASSSDNKSLSKTSFSNSKAKKVSSAKTTGSSKRGGVAPSDTTSEKISHRKGSSKKEGADMGEVGLECTGSKKVGSKKVGTKKGKGIGSKKGKKAIPMKGISQKQIRKSPRTGKSKVNARTIVASKATDRDIDMTEVAPSTMPPS